MRPSDPAYASFKRSISNHKMTIEQDNDVFRCIYFGAPGDSNQSFRLVTWPGCLAISGDMGDVIFSRHRDMFTFFRASHWRDHIPLEYWSEKLQSINRRPSDLANEFCDKLAKSHVVSDFRQVYPRGTPNRMDIWQDIRCELLSEDFMSEDNALHAVMNFRDRNGEYPFEDFYEHDLTEPTYRFKWLCLAIRWGIWKYDLARANRTQADHDRSVLKSAA